MKTFIFNPEQASRADSSGGIRESGKYILTIAQCAWRKGRDSQSEMIDFVLQDGNSKALSRLVIAKKDGSEAFGMRIFQSIMGLAGVQSAHAVESDVYALNGSKEKGYRIKEIERKKVGFILQYVEDKDENGFQVLNDRGWPKYRMEIRAVFDPETGKTFTEKKNGTEAKRVVQILAGLDDDCAKVRGDDFESQPRRQLASPAAAGAPIPSDDDVPF